MTETQREGGGCQTVYETVARLRTCTCPWISENLCENECIQRLTTMFSRISGDRIGIARGWKHLGGEEETCGLHMGGGVLGFSTKVVAREKRANAAPAWEQNTLACLPEGHRFDDGISSIPTKPARATRGSPREEKFPVHGLTDGRDSNSRLQPTRTTELWRSWGQRDSQTNPPATSHA